MTSLFTLFANLAIAGLATALISNYYRSRIVSRELKYWTFGPRFWTGWVDACVLWPTQLLGLCVTLFAPSPKLAITIVGLQTLLNVGYTVCLHAKYGQTVGKMVCKVRVVDHDTEGPITFKQALIRECIPFLASLGVIAYEIALVTDDSNVSVAPNGRLAYHGDLALLGLIPALWFFAEIVTMLSNDKRRALHDYLADTVVIRTNLESLESFAASRPLVRGKGV